MNQKRSRCSPRAILIAVLLLVGIPVFIGAEPVGAGPKLNGGLTAETFQFIRTEQRGFPPVFHDGELIVPGMTNAVGVFRFRYHGPGPVEFFGFGNPQDGKFDSRFTGYRVHDTGGWRELDIGYCGTGAATFPLLPDTDYELEISLAINGLAQADQVSVSFDSPVATFWSEPFSIPRE